jgi:hypothetical protein
MYVVDENLDGVARQVVPGDFSFLSLADRQIVEAMAKMIASLTGVSDDKPILLGTATVSKERIPYSYGDCTLLWKGMLYYLPKIESSNNARSFESFLAETYMRVEIKYVEPSPVYGEGDIADIYVHKNMSLMEGRAVDAEDEFTLREIQILPIIETIGNSVVVRPNGVLGDLNRT